MLAFCRNVLHWKAAEAAVYLALDDFLPGDVAAFIKANMPRVRAIPITSMVLLLFTANGVFEPMEVALNRAWGVTKNRPYWRNQLIALGLIFACGTLAMLSFLLTAINSGWLTEPGGPFDSLQNWINLLLFKLAALPISILALFLVYWLLPNRKIEPGRVAPVAILVGLLLEAIKYLNLLLFPLLHDKLAREYGVFRNSVAILLWVFIASLVVLGGAEWSAREGQKHPQWWDKDERAKQLEGNRESPGN